TLIMVNTTRIGGCANINTLAIFSMLRSSVSPSGWIHESGHGLVGLSDEYSGSGCLQHAAGEVNTSSNGSSGAWPEWVDDIGFPVEGGEGFDTCVYHPTSECQMLGGGGPIKPFCPVCMQHWALQIFGNPRINPTAPIESATPASPVATQTGSWTDFALVTRLPSGMGTTNELTWQIQGPGYPVSTDLPSTTPSQRWAPD